MRAMSAVKLVHFSNRDTIEPFAVDQMEHPWSPKPRGLWISDEADYGWSKWTTAESYGLGKNAFAVELNHDAKVLHLDSVEAIVEFNSTYGRDEYRVDWAAIADEWQAILITPYQWKLRLSNINWYYTWDCASGCIWDPAAFASITPLVGAS